MKSRSSLSSLPKMAEVKIYTTRYCPYCHAATALLTQKSVPFEEIAQIAGNLDRECYWLLSDPMQERDAEDIDLQLQRLREAFCRFGWMADHGLTELGAETVRGGADEWHLSPAYDELVREHQSQGGEIPAVAMSK